MTGSEPDEAMRAAARDVLRELMAGLVGDDAPGNRHANGRTASNGHANRHAHDSPTDSVHADNDTVVPQVPAPPVAAVLRPSTWSSPAAPGEVIGDGPPAPASPAPSQAGASRSAAAGPDPEVRVEPVTIDTDEDLQCFVRALVARVENASERLAIRAGRLRFALRRSGSPPAAPAARAAPVAAARSTRPPAPAAPAAHSAAIRVARGAVTERAVREAAADGARLVLAPGVVLTPLARDRARALGVEIERERRC